MCWFNLADLITVQGVEKYERGNRKYFHYEVVVHIAVECYLCVTV
jgi:hypothetical protein